MFILDTNYIVNTGKYTFYNASYFVKMKIICEMQQLKKVIFVQKCTNFYWSDQIEWVK